MARPMPFIINKKLEELDALVEKYPDTIPPAQAAEFLGVGTEMLKACIEHGNYEFALFYRPTPKSYGVWRILSVPFYLWYSHKAGIPIQ